jgi:hypothetical protein
VSIHDHANTNIFTPPTPKPTDAELVLRYWIDRRSKVHLELAQIEKRVEEWNYIVKQQREEATR